MQLTKTLTSVLAAAGLVGSIGLVYAQTTADTPTTPPAATATTPEPTPAVTTPAPTATTPAPATTPSPAAAPSDSTSLPPQQDRN